MNYTYKYRLYPTEDQRVLIAKHIGCSRVVYNYFLRQRIDHYEANKDAEVKVKSLSRFDQSKALTELKQKPEFAWLNEVNSQTLGCALINLDRAFQNFFSKRAEYPNFKKKTNTGSFKVSQGCRVENNRFYTIKFKEGIPAVIHRPLKGRIMGATISQTATGKYFVTICVECEDLPLLPPNDNAVGIDLGLKNLATFSDGTIVNNDKNTYLYAKKLRKAQRDLSRKKKGSNRYKRQKTKVARIHEKIGNRRSDSIHKMTTGIINEYSKIAMEDLSVKGMIKSGRLSKSVADASLGEIRRQIEYKAKWRGREVRFVDRFYPSSKTCHVCGWINKGLKLSQRSWTCENGHIVDRDINAAMNILKEGFKIKLEGIHFTSAEPYTNLSLRAREGVETLSENPKTSTQNVDIVGFTENSG